VKKKKRGDDSDEVQCAEMSSDDDLGGDDLSHRDLSKRSIENRTFVNVDFRGKKKSNETIFCTRFTGSPHTQARI
jgi:hypothetical protein